MNGRQSKDAGYRQGRWLVLLPMVLLALSVCSCGSSGGNSTASSTARVASTGTNAAASIPPAPVEASADSDKDNDAGVPGEDTRNTRVSDFGHTANATERRTITALVKRYYAAAVAEDGAQACSMIYSTLAEAIPEDYSGNPGVSYMQGAKTCAAAMTLDFRYNHPQLALEVPKLNVALVHLEGRHGLVQLSFGKMPERETSVTREGHIWKISALLDNELD